MTAVRHVLPRQMNAIIYCRVSSRDQVEGTSLDSQERQCRDYAHRNNYDVLRVFVEEGESAKFADRTQLLELIRFCEQKSNGVQVLIVWKLDRFARKVEDHFAIKARLRRLGVRVVSATEELQSDPNGKLMETLLAAFAEFDNDIRAVRCVQGMRQRIREGLFPWKPPLGYLPPKAGKKTKPDYPDPERFSVIQTAWRMALQGIYTKADILRFLRRRGVCGYHNRLLGPQFVDVMFGNRYYAGYVKDPWSGEEFIGRHQPMVTAEEFAAVQAIFSRRAKSRPHRRIREEFPLRGLVRCSGCGHYLTSCFARGARQRYPYYQCYNRDCAAKPKTYALSRVHTEFSEFLRTTALLEDLAPLVADALVETIADQTNAESLSAGARAQALNEIERQMNELVSMRTCQLISDDEFVRQRDIFRKRLLAVQSAETTLGEPLRDVEIQALLEWLQQPEAFWRALPPVERQVLGHLVFPNGYAVGRIRTAEKGLVVRVSEAVALRKSNVVDLAKSNSNALVSEIRKFIALIRAIQSPEKRAA